MPNPPPPQSLAALLARAEDFALFSMRSGGKVPPAILPALFPLVSAPVNAAARAAPASGLAYLLVSTQNVIQHRPKPSRFSRSGPQD